MNNQMPLIARGDRAHAARVRSLGSPWRVLAGLPLAIAAGGCQSYEPRPLDLPAARQAWENRSPSDENVRQFAQRLTNAEHASGRRHAEPFNPADGLTLAEAEPVALVFNRDLRLARLQANVTRATAENAGRWEDPIAGLDIERIVSGVSEPWVIAGTVGLTLPVSGRLAVERERASAEHDAQLRRLVAREWATRAALRELWMEWSAQSHRARLAEEHAERLGRVVALAGQQEQAGVMTRLDARVFSVEFAGSQADVIAARARAHELKLQLFDLLGLSPRSEVQLVESIAFQSQSTNSPAWPAEVDAGNAELSVVRAEYEVAERSLRLEVRKQYPDLTIGPGYGSDQGDDRILLGVSLPVPAWNRNRQAIAEATANRELARGRFESTFEHLSGMLGIARSRYEASRAVREVIETRVIPLADEQEADVRRVAELGRVDALLLLQAIKSQHDAKVRLIDARAAESIGAIRLDELFGPPIAEPRTESPSSQSVPNEPSPSQGGRP